MPRITFKDTILIQSTPNTSFPANTGGVNIKLDIDTHTTVGELHSQLLQKLEDHENDIYATIINDKKEPHLVEYNIMEIVSHFKELNGGCEDTLAFPGDALTDDSFVYITLVM